jgi:Protein of unknown function (DUF2459)
MTMAQRAREGQLPRPAATGTHRPDGQRRRSSPRVTVGALLGFLAGCAAPVAGLWPPAPGAPAQTIIVSVDSWHAMIAFPLAGEEGGAGTAPGPRFEEWGYAERGWYLEGRQGLGGVLRVVFRSSPGVVEVALSDRLWAERTPDPPADTFSFSLSEAGSHRLREHLRRTIVPGAPVVAVGASRFHAARDDYSLFHTCHQYAAEALRAAGLPLSPALAISLSAFAAQLRRAEGMAAAPARPHPGRL